MLPGDLQRLSDDMDAADAAAERLSASLTDAEFFWQPDGGTRWSVAQCLDHLAVADGLYGAAMASAVAHAREQGWMRQGPAAPGFFGRMFADSFEPPVKRRTGGPAKIRPRPGRTRAEILADYHAAHDAIRQAIQDAAALDVNRATFQNPFIPVIRMRVSTGLHVIAAHDRRHLWQAEQVVTALRARSATA